MKLWQKPDAETEWADAPVEPPMPTGPDSFPETGPNALAKIGLRAIARLLDAAMIGFPLVFIVALVLLATGYDPNDANADTLPVTSLTAAWFVVVFGYETVSVAWKGQTIGKAAVGIRVARLDNGRLPLWWQAGIRIALPAVILAVPNPFAVAVFMGVYISSQFDSMGRGLHDKAAGTIVVSTR